MAMAVCNSWNPLMPTHTLLCSLFFFYCLSLLVVPFLATAQPALIFNLTNIDTSNDNVIETFGNAYITNQGIQLTPEDLATDGIQKAGQATYKDPLHLWDQASGNLTDFNTYFVFIIDSQGNSSYADGITFFLVSNGSITPNMTAGRGIGLPIDPQTLTPITSFVAVEFDTFYNPGVDLDPATHVGIDINSLKSIANVTWYSNITYGIENEAWINYDSSSKILSVVLRTGSIDNNIAESSIDFLVDLRDYLPEWVTIGFSASTGDFFEKNSVKSWQFNSTLQIDVPMKLGPSPSPSLSPSLAPSIATTTMKMGGQNNKQALVVGLTVSSSVLVGGLALLSFVMWKKCRGPHGDDELAIELSMDNEFEAGIGPKKFTHSELFHATDNFAEEHKLGDGGFGEVYRVSLRESNSYVAVKRISNVSKQGIKEYVSEVKIISQLRHRNLVQLIDWCHDESELLVVYEFMENGSLDYHLFEEKSSLTWALRYKIAQDLALALLYLHEEWKQCVVHRNIKSSNVMLDSNFKTKLGDFGLARLVDYRKDSQTTVLERTRGYMAPECLVTGKTSKESDVYSFGVVALEIACGRKPIDLKVPKSQMRLVEWVWDLYGTDRLLEAAVDPKICPDFVHEEMECLMIVGLWCAHPDHNRRPSIRQAIDVLNFEAPLPNLPGKMPVSKNSAPPMNTLGLVSLTYGSTSVPKRSKVKSSSYDYNIDASNLISASATSSPSASLLHK